MKILYLVRGLPGSGKSTFAKMIGDCEHYETDMYFQRGLNNVYQFDASKLKQAHAWCQDLVHMAMIREVPKIAVSNTFTQQWEMDVYYELADKYGYTVFSIIVENRHGGVNEHNVPVETLDKMEKRFEIKLI